MCKKSLRALRLQRDMTQKELANEVGLSSKMISNYESDINSLRNASYSNLSNIANALGVEVEDIFLGPVSRI